MKLRLASRRGWRNLAGSAALALGLAFAPAAVHAQPFLGEWDMELDYQGSLIPSKLVLKSENGIVSGTWSSERGENEIANIKFENGKLSFTRKISFQDQEFDLSYTGTIEGDSIKGLFETPMGELQANGKRVGGPAEAPAPAGDVSVAGKWELTVDSPLGVNKRTLVLAADGSGSYEADYGKFPVANLKLDGNKLSFDLTLSMDGQDLAMKFSGTVADGKLTGELQSDQGGATVEGVLVEAAAAPAGAPSGGMAGKWKVSIDAPDGNSYQADFTVAEKDGKLSGDLVTELGEMSIKEIKVAGADVTFETEVDYGGVKLPFAFAGKLDGKKLAGTVKLNFEGQEMELPLSAEQVEAGAVAAAAAPAGAGGGFDGKWELSIESPDGASYEGKLEVATAGGTTSATLITDLGEVKIASIDVAGGDVSFKTEVDFGGVMVPLGFKGALDGEKVAGVVSLNFEGQEMEMPLSGKRVEGAAAAAPAPAGGNSLDGDWKLAIESPDGASYEGKLKVATAGGTTSATLITDLGEVKIDKIDVAGNDASFKTEVDFGGVMVPLGFKGTIDGAKIAGVVSLNFEGQEMEMPLTGEREGGAPAAAAAPAPAGGAGIAGGWELSIESPDGATYEGDLQVQDQDGRVSAVLVTELGEVKIDKLDVAGNEASFKTEVDFGGVMVPLSFKGTVDGDKLAGVVGLNFEGQEMEMPVSGKRKAGEAPAAAPSASTGLGGAWALKIESPDGATYEGDLNVADDGSAVLITELGEVKIAKIDVAGNEASFKTEVDFGGVMVPLSFKGTLEGDKMKGVVGLNFEGQEMEMPVEGERKGGAAAAAGGSTADLAGKWAMSLETPDGANYTGELTLKVEGGVISGSLSTDMGVVEIPALTLSGSDIDFKTEVDFGGTKVPVHLKGKVDGGKMEGILGLSFEGQEMEVPVRGEKVAAAAPAADVAGEWAVEVETPDGATSVATMTIAGTPGAYTATISSELGEAKVAKVNVDGAKVSFDEKVDFGGLPVPMKFSGSIDGGKITGTVNMTVDGQEMEMPLVGKKKEAAAAPAATQTASACCKKPNCGAGCKGSAGCGACCTG